MAESSSPVSDDFSCSSGLSAESETGSVASITSGGALYVVATPIGNLDDLSLRAIEVLKKVDLIAAEDTRHSARLLAHFDIRTPLMALHDHNERSKASQLVERVANGTRIALISDAGTPLISDPGYRVVGALREADLPVIPVPGACALITALCAAGLPTDRFRFEGFLPAKRSLRQRIFESVSKETATLVFYESPHRIKESLGHMTEVFADREIVLARELTKRFETFLSGSAAELLDRMEVDPDQAKGEFVVMIKGAPETEDATRDVDPDVLISALLEASVGVKQIANIVSRVVGGKKQFWYSHVLDKKDAM